MTAEMSGEQVVAHVCNEIKSQTGLVLGIEKITTQVLNKDGKWMNFDPAKIKFFYEK